MFVQFSRLKSAMTALLVTLLMSPEASAAVGSRTVGDALGLGEGDALADGDGDALADAFGLVDGVGLETARQCLRPGRLAGSRLTSGRRAGAGRG